MKNDFPNLTLYQTLKSVINKYSNNSAFTYNGSKTNYKMFLHKIDDVACSFAHLGVKKKDYVSIVMFNTPEVIISIYALNKLGAICNMINPLYSEEEIKYTLNLTKSKIVLTSSHTYEKINNIKSSTFVETIIKVEENNSSSRVFELKNKLFHKSNNIIDNSISFSKFMSLSKKYKQDIKESNASVAFVVYSDSSSNKLNAVVLTNSNINSFASSFTSTIDNIKNNSSMLNILPIFTGFGISLSHFAYINGLEEIITNSNDLRKFDWLVIKNKPEYIFTTPSLVNILIHSKKVKNKDLSFVERIVCTKDALSESLCKKVNNFLYEHNSSVLLDNMYGLNESACAVCITRGENNKLGSIGKPLNNNTIKIYDSNTNKFLGANKLGEICISGNQVMKEYLNNKEETESRLIKHNNQLYLHTNDIGYIDSDGYVYFESKMNDVIISSGYKIYRRGLEEVIMSHPYVDKCAIVGLPHPYKKEVVKAYIVLKKGLILNSEIKRSIREYCEKNIAEYALPYAYGYRKKIPQNLIGKVSYKDLINDKDEEI